MIVRTSMVFSPTTAKQRISQKKSGAFRRLDSGSPQQSEEGVQLLRGQQRSQTLLLQNCSSALGWEPRKIESRNSEGETTMRNTPWNGLQTWRMVAKLGDFLRLPKGRRSNLPFGYFQGWTVKVFFDSIRFLQDCSRNSFFLEVSPNHAPPIWWIW